MKTNDQIAVLPRQGVSGVATEDVQNVHASSRRERRESRDDREMFRIRLLGIGGLAIIMWGLLLARSGDFRHEGHGGAAANAVAPAVAPATASAVTQVSMRNLQFYPVTLKLRQGDVVEWKNDDLVPHTATSASFNSGTIVAGQSWRHEFADAGNFPYVCTFHPQMKGVVIVK
jgi:plastocyanin